MGKGTTAQPVINPKELPAEKPIQPQRTPVAPVKQLVA
jgi:hypothetical protein